MFLKHPELGKIFMNEMLLLYLPRTSPDICSNLWGPKAPQMTDHKLSLQGDVQACSWTEWSGEATVFKLRVKGRGLSRTPLHSHLRPLCISMLFGVLLLRKLLGIGNRILSVYHRIKQARQGRQWCKRPIIDSDMVVPLKVSMTSVNSFYFDSPFRTDYRGREKNQFIII